MFKNVTVGSRNPNGGRDWDVNDGGYSSSYEDPPLAYVDSRDYIGDPEGLDRANAEAAARLNQAATGAMGAAANQGLQYVGSNLLPSMPSLSGGGMLPSTPVIANGVAPGMISTGLGAGAVAIPVAATAYNIAQDKPKESALWGSLLNGAMFGAPALAAGAASLVRGSPSHPETRDRRTAIDAWQERGFIDDNENMQLGNGNSLYFADPRDPRTYNIDQERLKTDRSFADLVGFLDPIAALMSANSGKQYNNSDPTKLRTDMTGMLTNALQNAKGGSPIENAVSLAQSLGLDRDTLYNSISNMASSGQIDKGTMDAWHAGIDLGYNVRNPNASAEDNARFDAFQQNRGLTSGAGVSGQAAQVTPWMGQPQPVQTQAPQPQMPQAPRQPTMGSQGLKTATPGLNYNPVATSQSLFPAPLRQAEAAKPKPPANIGSNLQGALAQAGIQTAPLPERQGVNIPTSLPGGLRNIIYTLMQERQR